MKISQIINMKMPNFVGIFIFISRENFMLRWAWKMFYNLEACSIPAWSSIDPVKLVSFLYTFQLFLPNTASLCTILVVKIQCIRYRHVIHLACLVRIAADDILKFFFLLFPENRLWYIMQTVSKETICMKCQSLFFWKNRKNIINLLNFPTEW